MVVSQWRKRCQVRRGNDSQTRVISALYFVPPCGDFTVKVSVCCEPVTLSLSMMALLLFSTHLNVPIWLNQLLCNIATDVTQCINRPRCILADSLASRNSASILRTCLARITYATRNATAAVTDAAIVITAHVHTALRKCVVPLPLKVMVVVQQSRRITFHAPR
jgi:hypothetical protein